MTDQSLSSRTIHPREGHRPLLVLGLSFGLGFGLAATAEAAESFVPTGATFQQQTLRRVGPPGVGDNWNLTWAADHHQYTSCDDGTGWGSSQGHSHYVRVNGDSATWTPTQTPYPAGPMDYYFGYGTISVRGTLYQFLSRQFQSTFKPPFQGLNLIYSHDNAKTWFRHDGLAITGKTLDPHNGLFSWREQPYTRDGNTGYAFAWVSCVQHGKDNTAAPDEYVYLYAPDGARPHRANLARVHRDRITDRTAYQFFVGHRPDGGADWSNNIADRGAAVTFPTSSSAGVPISFYSWLPNVVYNQALGRYIMCTGATYNEEGFWGVGHPMHKHSGSLALYHATNAWGPWTRFHYDEHWRPAATDKTYLPTLSPKWISNDGRDMVLVWSDYYDSWGDHYLWNQMKITLTGVDTPQPGPVARWRMDDTGSTATDMVGSQHLNLAGGAGWTSGRINGALALNGNGDVSKSTVSAELRPQSLTVAAWVRSDQSTQWAWVAAQGDNYGLVLNRSGTSDDVFFYAYDGIRWANVSSGDVNVCDGGWHHVAATYGNGRMRVYLDGVQVGDAAAPPNIAYHIGQGFTVGSMQGQRRFAGAIDDVAVYNHVLSAAAIAELAVVQPPPPSEEPVARWSLNETSGTTANDAIGNNDLSLSAGTAWTTGPLAGALDLDGSGHAASSSVTDALRPQTLTIAAWVRSDQATRWAWVAAQGDNYGLVLNRHHNTDDINFYIHGGDAWHNVSSGDVNVCDGAWHHVVATLGGGRMRVYLDGNQVGDAPAPASGIAYSLGNGFTVGSMKGERRFDGAIDEVVLYNRPLSATAIAQLASAQPPPPPPTNDPIARWSLDETSGIIANDAVGSHDLDLSGGTAWINGSVGGALDLDGSGHASVANVATALRPQTLTIAAWVRSDQSTKWAWVAAQGDNYGLVINRYGDSDDVFFYAYDGSAWKHVSSGDVNVCDGAWHHVAATVGGGRMRVYLDGALVGDAPAPANIAYATGNGFTIGSMQGQRNFAGAIDEVALYARVLSASEIADLAEMAPTAGGLGLLREVWLDIEGTSLSAVPWNNSPDVAVISDDFEAPSNWGHDYATRLRGFIHPPSNGDYIFTIAGDDDCELWLSTSESPSAAVRIAGFHGWTGVREWNKHSGQRSWALRLSAGRAYYIEARQKEGRGGDHLAVAWEGPGISRQVIRRAALSPWAGISPSPTLRVLTLGDSITQGDDQHRSYRYGLWTDLVDSGFRFDLVGSQSDNHLANPVWPNYAGRVFDRNHEGRWGWRADQVADQLPGWLSSYTADLVLLHLGTNDALQGQSTSSTLDDLTRIVNALRIDNPRVRVLVARPIPTVNASADARLVSLSNALDGFAATLDRPDAPVMVVDQRTGFTTTADTYDGVHPNASGEAKMAARWFEAILKALAQPVSAASSG